jgi:hypothetical protein
MAPPPGGIGGNSGALEGYVRIATLVCIRSLVNWIRSR